jgi:hypothetical protein
MNRCVVAAVLASILSAAGVHAHDQSKYPDWKGQWNRKGAGNFDPAKPFGLGQQAPLTQEYQAILEASVASQAAGGQGNNPMAACKPPAMPRMMIIYGLGMEIVITPETTYMIFGEPMSQLRRIFTDGRQWPRPLEPTTTSGYSIGQWQDTDGDGRYDLLSVETRAIKGPRSYDSSGMPFHRDGKTVVRERFYLDKKNADVLVNETTVEDSALTRPWTVTRRYHRGHNPAWLETICGEDERQLRIGGEDYFVSGDGFLMPTRKGQPPPDLRRFDGSRK